MFWVSQRGILSLYHSGRTDEAFALQRALQGGRLGVRQALALNASVGDGPSGRPRLFACGEYEPRRQIGSGPRAETKWNVGGLGCSFSEAILRLKSLRPPGPRAPGLGDAEALIGTFAVRLARCLRLLRGRGLEGAVTVATVPGAGAGTHAFGLDQVVRRACVLAGAEFRYQILLLRGKSGPRAHLGAGPRAYGPQVLSLMPIRVAKIQGRSVVLVDDVVSSGCTLNAAVTLVGLYNEARVVGLALAKTRARRKDSGGVEVLEHGRD